MNPPQAASKVPVRVLAVDERICLAAQGLPADRFEVHLHSEREELLDDLEGLESYVGIFDLHPGGFAAAKDVRERPEGKRVVLVLLCERPQDRWICAQAGADVVLVKPIESPQTLIEAVDKAINSRENSGANLPENSA